MLVYPAAAVDVICVLAFATIGRSSHAEVTNLSGVLHTAWPFLVGCGMGLAASRSWREPLSTRTGVVVWLGTVAAGVGLRLLSGSTAQLPFVIVAALTLGVLLVGWRAVARLVQGMRPADLSTRERDL